jgi:hypothetical protein
MDLSFLSFIGFARFREHKPEHPLFVPRAISKTTHSEATCGAKIPASSAASTKAALASSAELSPEIARRNV